MAEIVRNDFSLRSVAMLILMAGAVSLSVIFIEQYCELFGQLSLVAKRRLLDNPAMTFVTVPAFFWMSACLCRKFAPNASGNSIEHIRESIKASEKRPENFDKLSDNLGLKVIIVKTISSLLCVFGGGALGREGPAVHMTSGVFAVISYRFRQFLPKAKLETWIMAGSATGMAIAFHAPISGFVFASEKILRSRSNNFIINLAWISIVTFMVMIAFQGYGPLFIVANMDMTDAVSEQFSAIMLTAIICGFVAFIFKKTNGYFYAKFAAITSRLWHIIPIVAGFAVASISFYCGIYSFGGGMYEIDKAVLSPHVILSYKEVVGRIMNVMITYVSGCAGGLVAPAIAIGTGIGSVISSFVTNIDPNILLLIGMSAFLGAVLGEPLTAAVIIFEITGQSVMNLSFLLCASVMSFLTFKLVDNFFSSD